MQRPSYKVFNYTLKAGEQVNIHHRANSLNCLSATARFQIAFDDAPLTGFEKGLGYNTPVPFSKVRLLNDGAETIKIELGFASGGVTDSRLNLPSAIDANITNETLAVTGTVEANITNATLVARITNALTIAGGRINAIVTGTVDANITNAVLATTVGNTVATKEAVASRINDSKTRLFGTRRQRIANQNNARKEVMITNLGNDIFYLGGDNVGDGEGLPVGAGKTATLTTTAAVYAWNEENSITPIAVLEVMV